MSKVRLRNAMPWQTKTIVFLVAVVAFSACSTAEEQAPALLVNEIAEGSQDANLDLEVAGPMQVNFREITIPPGLSTGKHCHYGNLIGVVKAGTLTHYAPIYPDGVHEYRAGDSLVEGPGYVHEGRNEGDDDVVLWVTYVTPSGEPLAESELKKCEQPEN